MLLPRVSLLALTTLVPSSGAALCHQPCASTHAVERHTSRSTRSSWASPRAAPVRAVRVLCCATADSGPFGAELWQALSEVVDEEADELGVSIHELAFRKGKLCVLVQGAGVDELQQINSRVGQFLDAQEETDALPPYLLEVSSPGVSSTLQSEADFTAFKGFPVTVELSEEWKKKTCFEGTLMGRDDEHVTINLKGRVTNIPREMVKSVSLPKAQSEAGDPYNSV